MSIVTDPAQPQEELPVQPRRMRRVWVVLIVVAALLLAIGIVVLGALLNDRDGSPGDGGPGEGDRTISGPLAGREQATLVLLDGATSVTVRIGDLGDRLYQAETPEGGAHLPVAEVAGDEVRVELTDEAGDGPSAVDVQLSSAVRWNVRVLGGSSEQIIDLRNGHIDGVELAGGATRIELSLPPPEGVTTVRMTGGAGEWVVHQVGAAPVRLRAGGGAGSVTIDGEPHSGVSAGTAFAPPEWDSADDRVDLDAVAGMSTFILDRG